MKKPIDAIQTCRWTGKPFISRKKAHPSHSTIDKPNKQSDPTIVYVFHCIRLEQSGKRHKYQVKYCAVKTLLCVTKRNVWRKRANGKSCGAIPRLEYINNKACGSSRTLPIMDRVSAAAMALPPKTERPLAR